MPEPPRRMKPLSPLSPCAMPVGEADSEAPVVTDAIRVEAQSFLKTPSATPSAAAGVGAARSSGVAWAFGNSAWRQVVPGDERDKRVDPRVGAGEHQRQRAAVRTTGDAHPRVTRTVELHLGLGGEPVDKRARIRDLVVQGVEGDLPGGPAEPTRRVGEHHEPVARGLLRVGGERALRAAEAVRHEDRRCRNLLGEVQGRVQRHRLGNAWTAGDGDLHVPAGHGFWLRVRPHDQRDRGDEHDHDGNGDDLARAGGEQPLEPPPHAGPRALRRARPLGPGRRGIDHPTSVPERGRRSYARTDSRWDALVRGTGGWRRRPLVLDGIPAPEDAAPQDAARQDIARQDTAPEDTAE